MLKKVRNYALLGLIMVFVVSVIGCGGDQQTGDQAANDQQPVSKIVLKAGHGAGPDSLNEFAFNKMNDIIKEKTNGQIEIEIHGNEALGTEVQMLEQLQLGTIDLVTTSGAPVTGFVKEFMVCDLPFTFASSDEAYAFYDGEIGQALFEKANASGMVGLAWWENGFRNFTNNSRAIASPADMTGLKIRTMQSQVHMASVNALGANAVPIAFGELYTALQQGVVDGQENPLTLIKEQKFYEVQKYLTISRHVYDPSPLFISPKTLDKLTDEQVAIVKEAALEARDAMRIRSNEQEKQIIADLKAGGMQVTELTPEQVKAFQDATQDIAKEFRDKIGSEFLNDFLTATGR